MKSKQAWTAPARRTALSRHGSEARSLANEYYCVVACAIMNTPYPPPSPLPPSAFSQNWNTRFGVGHCRARFSLMNCSCCRPCRRVPRSAEIRRLAPPLYGRGGVVGRGQRAVIIVACVNMSPCPPPPLPSSSSLVLRSLVPFGLFSRGAVVSVV